MRTNTKNEVNAIIARLTSMRREIAEQASYALYDINNLNPYCTDEEKECAREELDCIMYAIDSVDEAITNLKVSTRI
ncbi:MAG: hypothetical protein ACI4TD_00670 [Phocaeicola sp.]